MTKPHKLSAKAKIRLQYYRLRIEVSKFFEHFSKPKIPFPEDEDVDENQSIHHDEEILNYNKSKRKSNRHTVIKDELKSKDFSEAMYQGQQSTLQNNRNKNLKPDHLNAETKRLYGGGNINDKRNSRRSPTQRNLVHSVSSTHAAIRPSSVRTVSSEESTCVKNLRSGFKRQDSSRRKRSARTKNRQNYNHDLGLGSLDIGIINGGDHQVDDKEDDYMDKLSQQLNEAEELTGTTFINSQDNQIDSSPQTLPVHRFPASNADHAVSQESFIRPPMHCIEVPDNNKSSIMLHNTAALIALASTSGRSVPLKTQGNHLALTSNEPDSKGNEITKAESPPSNAVTFKDRFRSLISRKRPPSIYEKAPREMQVGFRFVFQHKPARQRQLKKAEAKALKLQKALEENGSIEDLELEEYDDPESFTNTLLKILPPKLTGYEPPAQNQNSKPKKQAKKKGVAQGITANDNPKNQNQDQFQRQQEPVLPSVGKPTLSFPIGPSINWKRIAGPVPDSSLPIPVERTVSRLQAEQKPWRILLDNHYENKFHFRKSAPSTFGNSNDFNANAFQKSNLPIHSPFDNNSTSVSHSRSVEGCKSNPVISYKAKSEFTSQFKHLFNQSFPSSSL